MLKISKKTSLNEILKKFISFIQKILDFIMRENITYNYVFTYLYSLS